ncbi:hypothetical protein JD292_01535 [Leucobacter sp. CSA2]|uniref:Uncharacterized protein n=1 Tax=Leucobacter edaphi TaxID=2796472 RepID=A0A934Q9R2_9MICO|nr:hypothetical protein [Leucobacter edaphi]MBK0420764.1 hypothetical protein [Leucobacter edaphi]
MDEIREIPKREVSKDMRIGLDVRGTIRLILNTLCKSSLVDFSARDSYSNEKGTGFVDVLSSGNRLIEREAKQSRAVATGTRCAQSELSEVK